MLNHYNVEDFSCEIDMPMKYLDFIRDYLDDDKNKDEHGRLLLSSSKAESFAWMLSTAGTVIYRINKAFYGEESETNFTMAATVPAQEETARNTMQSETGNPLPGSPFNRLPYDMTMPGGAKITMEDLVYKLAILKSVLHRHLDEATCGVIREPLGYPEIHGLYDIASSAYYALAATLYAEEITKDENYI